ncbi:MAG: zf-HC2 domain-containing protein [marine benthic group bacterium]|jgi:anti-sigma factor (TIGR02949 family)|nr:zf-HC2 domain-containing protein [Candidatus Carthagonibacter metallireducens]
MNDQERPEGIGPHEAPEELSCEESLALVYEFLDGELPAERNEAVRRHVQKCRRCYPHFDFERIFLDYVNEAGRAAVANPDLERRIRALIAEDEV